MPGTAPEAPFAMAGTGFHLAVPRAAPGLGPERGPLAFRFKWADGVPPSGERIDFLVHGDAAPNGRFTYFYEEEPPATRCGRKHSSP